LLVFGSLRAVVELSFRNLLFLDTNPLFFWGNASLFPPNIHSIWRSVAYFFPFLLLISFFLRLCLVFFSFSNSCFIDPLLLWVLFIGPPPPRWLPPSSLCFGVISTQISPLKYCVPEYVNEYQAGFASLLPLMFETVPPPYPPRDLEPVNGGLPLLSPRGPQPLLNPSFAMPISTLIYAGDIPVSYPIFGVNSSPFFSSSYCFFFLLFSL